MDKIKGITYRINEKEFKDYLGIKGKLNNVWFSSTRCIVHVELEESD